MVVMMDGKGIVVMQDEESTVVTNDEDIGAKKKKSSQSHWQPKQWTASVFSFSSMERLKFLSQNNSRKIGFNIGIDGLIEFL